MLPNLSELLNTPGVTHKVFCSFSCVNEATGDLEVEPGFKVPVCEDCVKRLLDTPE